MKVLLNGKYINVRKNSKISYLIRNHHFYYKALVDNELVDLNYRINKECKIFLLDLRSNIVMRCYEATLRFIFVMSLKKLNLSTNVRFNYTISRALFVYIDKHNEVIEKINKMMNEIIEKKLKINNLGDDYFECDGFKLKMNYDLFSDTSMVKRFKLYPIYPGIIIQFPRSELNGNIPILSDSIKYFKELNDSLKYVVDNKIDTIDKLNKELKNKETIEKLESTHKEKINKIVNEIINKEKSIVLITGPSSSGKTTLAGLIKNKLNEIGKKTFLISIDDYYLNRTDVPMVNNVPDYETVEAFDYDGLNKHLSQLLNYESVALKKYDFKTGISSKTEPKKIDRDTIIILEGIHALNDIFSKSIDRIKKYKIFISPQCLINFDDYNPITISDIRLIRRSIRDFKHRKTSFIQTLEMWENVRKGEYKWIYPFQDDSDYTFNTFMPYELNVVKKQALELMDDVVDGKHYYRVKTLMELMEKFDSIDENLVPSDSIINEFIK